MRLARFAAVGALGIGVQLTVWWVLVGALGTFYLRATIIAVSAAIAHNFLWHRRWTWGERKTDGWAAAAAFTRFVLGNGLVSAVGNTVVMVALVGGLGVHPVAASLGAIGVCGLVNFVLADRLVFRASRSQPPALGLR